MFKKIKILITIVILIGMTSIVLVAMETNYTGTNNSDNSVNGNFPFVENKFLESSRFTQKQEVSAEKINEYKNNFQIEYTEDELDFLGYQKVLENSSYILYFDNDSYSIILIDRDTGFTWSSRAEFQDDDESNDLIRNQMNSGIWIDYVNTKNQQFQPTRSSVYQSASVKYYLDRDAEALEGFEHLYRYKINNTTYNKTLMEIKSTVDNQKNEITSSVNYKALNISFEIKLTLGEDGINVFIDKDKIQDDNPTFQLTNIYVFPYLASARQDKVPGYFMIPDGVGTLVRFGKVTARDFLAKFYGNDLGYNDNYLPQLSLPIYGVVHMENENAMYAVINEGAEVSLLEGIFYGQSSSYFRMNTRYAVRQVYFNVIDRAGNGYRQLLKQKASSNFDISFNFLKDDKANYVGIAKEYQKTLIENEILTKREVANENIPLNVEYLMSEREKSFFGTKKITMSTTSEVSKMYNFFKDSGINNQIVNLKGYSKSGNMNTTPYKLNLIESKSNFKSLVNEVQGDDNSIFLTNDYTRATSESKRISYGKDVARNTSKLRYNFETKDINNNIYDRYILYPQSSLKYINQDNKKLSNIGFDGWSLDSETNRSQTVYQSGKYYDRNHSINIYQEMFDTVDKIQMYQPNLYALKHAYTYLDLPITNSQYDYYSDLIPLIPLILKGYISYFTPVLNYNALGRERLLTMVDFGTNPSYILTYSPTYKMRHTMSFIEYSTTFSDYQYDIVNEYNYVNNALKHVINTDFINREVIETGVVLNTYSNGVKIYINYTSSNFNLGNITVNANDYKVVLK
ncbi:DUF5696 domain-containing protein [Haploplasma modicum]|uniref:DUF5696 domain-containing protein n=1 Tax=Haploplasma modicum TaxID=2150 RepID=UPI00138B1808|nr:DUF5696 domain-containing protein [Haploplasma modicum]